MNPLCWSRKATCIPWSWHIRKRWDRVVRPHSPTSCLRESKISYSILTSSNSSLACIKRGNKLKSKKSLNKPYTKNKLHNKTSFWFYKKAKNKTRCFVNWEVFNAIMASMAEWLGHLPCDLTVRSSRLRAALLGGSPTALARQGR